MVTGDRGDPRHQALRRKPCGGGSELHRFKAATRAEWTKLCTVRSTIWALIFTVVCIVGRGALLTALEVSRWDHRSIGEVVGFDPLLYAFAGLPLAQLCIGVLGGAVHLMLIGVIAVGLGAALRHTAGAVAVFVGALLVLPGLVLLLPSPWDDDVTKFLPGSAGVAISAIVRFPNLLSPGA